MNVFRTITTLAAAAAGTLMPAGADEAPPVDRGLSETVTVTASRLEGNGPSLREVPAFVTVITREQIERSGARTLQDLLALEAGVVLLDQIGNDFEKTFDLRGFPGGSGTAFFLDGARLNDPRNNSVPLETIPVDAIERVEILRGSSSTLAGGGAEAGVVHLVTRRGGPFGGSLSLDGGSHDATRARGTLTARTGRFDLFVSAGRDRTDGFRDNADAELRRFAATGGVDLGKDRRLSLTLLSTDARLGQPGALTPDELDRDRGGAPFNVLDGSDGDHRLASLNYRGRLSDRWSLAGNVFLRDQESEILSTGRSAEAFGGFFLDSEGRTGGTTLQASHLFRGTSRENALTLGVEWLDGETDARGFFTPPSNPSNVDPSRPDSSNLAKRRTLALFAQDSWAVTRKWTLSAGARLDSDRMSYEERVPDPSLRDSRTFSEISLRGGVSWNPTEHLGAYASYGEAFLPPTVEQLFAFPLFGSNPDLEPQDSRTWEAGFRARWSGRRAGSLDASLFQVETTNEIVFRGTFGPNENAGRTRRRGLEAAVSARLSGFLDAFLNASVTDARFRGGDDAGKVVPLVPRERVSAGFDVALPGGVASRLEVLSVGDQVLDNDESNSRARLDSYTVVNLRASWSRTVSGRSGTDGERPATLTFHVEARNLLDREYATRGIHAFDFATFRSSRFLTPAPGRRLFAGAEWSF